MNYIYNNVQRNLLHYYTSSFITAMTKKTCYVVVNGRLPGIYNTWTDCQQQITGYSNAVFKGFATLNEAHMYMKQNNMNTDYNHTNSNDNSNFTTTNRNNHDSQPTNNTTSMRNNNNNSTSISTRTSTSSTSNSIKQTKTYSKYPPQQPASLSPKRKAQLDTLLASICKRLLKNQNIKLDSVTMYTDGASRNNPGHAGGGIYVKDNNSDKYIQCAQYLGLRTNNEAEYTALLYGIELCMALGVSDINICIDSKLIQSHINGTMRITANNLYPIYNKIIDMKQQFKTFKIQWVPREQNTIADRLSNQAIDERRYDIDNMYRPININNIDDNSTQHNNATVSASSTQQHHTGQKRSSPSRRLINNSNGSNKRQQTEYNVAASIITE